MQRLPIDPQLPEVVEAVNESRSLVLEAPPGAGKTTRVPAALYDAGVTNGCEVLVAEPRRLAARLSARRVAAERGEALGALVGYAVRFENKGGANTRIRYVTEGILLRRLVGDPNLSGVGLVVLDEFHERHLTTDLCLVLLRRLQRSTRRDLKLVVMSATLDGAEIARFLDDCPRLRSEGRQHEVRIEHLKAPDDRPLAKQVVSAVKRALSDAPPGDQLVFLPGAAEIRQATDELVDTAKQHDLQVLPLHGDLTIEQQARAIAPSAQKKIVLSTNVAESSVTIDGVTAVVDSGLARVAAWSPWSGLAGLVTQPISRASAAQRAGRAGRTQPGVVYRLYTRGDHDRRPEQTAPELTRADLTEAVLLLHGAGVTHPAELQWLTPPPAAAVTAAEKLLRQLGAVDDGMQLSDIGQRLLELSVHPRLGRVLVECERRGIPEDGALVAALLSERDIRLGARAKLDSTTWRSDGRASSDIEELADRFHEAQGMREHSIRALGIDPRAVAAVERARRHLRRSLRSTDPPETEETRDEALALALLAGYPDRVARRREAGARELVLASGDTARLSPRSVVHDAPFLVAIGVEDARGRSGAAWVHLASRIDPDWLLELYTDELIENDELVWNPAVERVDRVRRISYGSVVLDELRSAASPSLEAGGVLARAARAVAWEQEELDRVTARLTLLEAQVPEAQLSELIDRVPALLESACENATTFAELRATPLVERLMTQLDHTQVEALRELAPESVKLPGGRRLSIQYVPGQPPWAASRLQDFFGLGESPRIAKGRVPLTLHLLAPNRRAVQVTTDLQSFWAHHYPALRRELMRRYPKHDWPEDGATATPPPVGRLRARR